jgi:hypothetical protein
MRRLPSSVAILFVLFSVAFAAQAKPNFAGKWTLTGDPSAAGMMTPASITVTQDDKTLTVAVVGQMGEIKTAYNLDGSEGKSPIEFNGNSIDRVTKSAWDGSKLLLTTIANFQGQSFETKQVWTLGADGTLTVEATRPDFQGGGAPVTTKAVYKKS